VIQSKVSNLPISSDHRTANVCQLRIYPTLGATRVSDSCQHILDILVRLGDSPRALIGHPTHIFLPALVVVLQAMTPAV